MKNNSSALILLSTYNGEKYLEAQLDSLISQTFTNWVLLVRDDGSTDATISLLETYAQSEPRIIIILDNLGNLKAQKSFSTLMQHAADRSEEFIFFCDQDDIWLPEKISQQVALLTDLQNACDFNTPVLVHSDLCVVDINLKVIHPSYLAFEKLSRNTQTPINTLLINNYVTGCTVGMNKALLNIAKPIPDNAFMHDWWCALCAAVTGKIGFIETATVLYRQHSNNSIGSSGFYGKFKELRHFKGSLRKRQNNLIACFNQAKNLLARINENNKYYHLIKKFTDLSNKNKLLRYLSASTLQLQPAGKIRGFLFWALLASISTNQ